MPVETAVHAHSQQGTNCAQAILHGFQHVLHIPAERIAEAIAHGGGRAPEGLCGALHSALELADDACRAELREAFRERAGAITCREVRRLGRLTCPECVRTAAELLRQKIVAC